MRLPPILAESILISCDVFLWQVGLLRDGSLNLLEEDCTKKGNIARTASSSSSVAIKHVQFTFPGVLPASPDRSPKMNSVRGRGKPDRARRHRYRGREKPQQTKLVIHVAPPGHHHPAGRRKGLARVSFYRSARVRVDPTRSRSTAGLHGRRAGAR
jgi:hypothetical protein